MGSVIQIDTSFWEEKESFFLEIELEGRKVTHVFDTQEERGIFHEKIFDQLRNLKGLKYHGVVNNVSSRTHN